MSDAVNPFGDDHEGRPEPKWKVRRERAVWYGVVGIGLMFAGQISTAFAVGGAGMALFGIVEYIRWTLKRPKADDPWRDPDIDAWEDAHYSGEGLADEAEADAPDVGSSNPDEAWGVHEKRF